MRRAGFLKPLFGLGVTHSPGTGAFGPNTGDLGPNTGDFGPNTGDFGPDTGAFTQCVELKSRNLT